MPLTKMERHIVSIFVACGRSTALRVVLIHFSDMSLRMENQYLNMLLDKR